MHWSWMLQFEGLVWGLPRRDNSLGMAYGLGRPYNHGASYAVCCISILDLKVR